MSQELERRCQTCGGRLDSVELKNHASKCSLCRDPLRGEDYGTTILGLVAGGLLCVIAFNSIIGGVIGAVAGALLGRVVQKHLDLKRKLELMKNIGEARLSLSEVERKRKLEAERTASTDRGQ